MTREEALQWLTNEKWKNANNTYEKEWNEAFDISIEALKDRPQGEWIEEFNGNGWNDFWDYTCSHCGKKYIRADYLYHANYCPNCGARMKGGAE